MADFEKKVGLIEVQIDNAAALKQVDALTLAIADQKNTVKANAAEIKALEKANADLEKAVKAGTTTQDEASAAIKENEAEIKRLTVATAKEQDQLKDLNNERRQAVKVSKTQSDSLNALRVESAKLKKALNEQEAATEEGRAAFDALSDQLKGVNDKIRELDKGAGDFKTNVGNYPEMLDSIGGGLGGMASGFIGATKAALAFLATPIGMVLGLIGAAFMLVKSAIERNEELMNKLKMAIAPVSAAFGYLMSALEPLVEFLIEGLVVAIEKAGKAIDWLVGSVADGLAFLGFEDAAASVREFNEEIKEVGKNAQAILQMELNVRALNRALKETSADLEGQIALLEQMAGDATLSFQQQRAAAEKSIQLQEQLRDEKKKTLEESIRLTQGQIAQAKIDGVSQQDLLDTLADLNAEKIRLDNEYTLAVQTNAQLRRQIAQDEWELALDYAIDVGTRRTEEALKASENEQMSLEQRKAAIIEAKRLNESAFENQIKLFEQTGIERDHLNRLILESDAAEIDSQLKKTGLTQIERNRLRELILERGANIQAIKDAEAGLTEYEKTQAAERAAAQKDLDNKLNELADARIAREYAQRLRSAQSEAEYIAILKEQEDYAHQDKMDRLDEQEEELLTQKFDHEEERLAAEAEIKIAREEQLAAHEATLAEIEANSQRLRMEQLIKFGEDVKKATEAGAALAYAITDIASSSVEARYRKRFTNLENQLKSGQITEEEYAAKKEHLEQQQALAQWRIAKVNHKINKLAALGALAASIAIAVGKSVQPSPLTAGQPWAGIALGIQGIQTAAILAQPAPPKPTFAQGGDVFGAQINGRSHANGGESIYVGGRYFGEMQGGEGLFVTKREATNPALQLLNSANTAFGGSSMFGQSSRFLQNGGMVSDGGGAMSAQELAAALSAMPTPVVEVQSIMAGINAEVQAKRVGTI